MSNSKKITNVASVLCTKASGCAENIQDDLNQPDGKCIAELINDQEKSQAEEIPVNTSEQCK